MPKAVWSTFLCIKGSSRHEILTSALECGGVSDRRDRTLVLHVPTQWIPPDFRLLPGHPLHNSSAGSSVDTGSRLLEGRDDERGLRRVSMSATGFHVCNWDRVVLTLEI